LHTGSVVVRAGPGSGKTRTLVAKVAYLLAAVVEKHQGVAAMTYTNQAAREVTRRLARLGLRPGRRLASRTVHSWCLTAVLHPYAHLTGIPMPAAGGVVDDSAALGLLEECLDDAQVYEKATWVQPLITKIRRSIAAGLDVEGFDEAKTEVARLFEQRLVERNLIDYEAMVGRALELLRTSAPVRELVAARFPWLVVDEYQDLGPVLHELVLTMHEQAGVQVCAVGDPDQSVMGFTGADPRYLEELVDHEGFLEIGLDLNYRSGSAIIAASQAALGDKRDHRADPDRTDAGVVEPVAVNGGLDDHARLVVEKIEELTGAGVPSDQIAVLYPRRGLLLDRLTQALTDAGIGFVHERDQRLPTGPLVEFLRRCASRRLAGPQPCGHGLVIDIRAAAPIIPELTSEFLHLAVGKRAGRPGVEIGELLQGVLDREPERGVSLDEERLTWLIERLDSTLELRALAASTPEQRDRTAISALEQLDEGEDFTLEQFAAQDLSLGKIVLTTYHSAKGREFSVVILPGLVEGIVPYLAWSKRLGRHEEPARAVMAEQRRTFYVAFTRAADAAVLVYGPGFQTEWGAWNDLGPSRFVVDVVEHLDQGK
jgi:DNA helicase-2/ATP-dependent DNA helicase PcrA